MGAVRGTKPHPCMEAYCEDISVEFRDVILRCHVSFADNAVLDLLLRSDRYSTDPGVSRISASGWLRAPGTHITDQVHLCMQCICFQRWAIGY